MGKKITGMVGKRFGRWTVIGEEAERGAGGVVRYLCHCDCGNEKTVSGSILRKGDSTSCGCYNREVITKECKFYKEKLYSVWLSMKQRCSNPKDKAFKNYGGRGIKVCDEWLNNYQKFREWALSSGYKQGLWIDRIDNNGNYSPSNCKWATTKEQSRNKRTTVMLSIAGETKCLTDWANSSGIKACTIKRRMELGWNEDHLLDPIEQKYSHSEAIKTALCK